MGAGDDTDPRRLSHERRRCIVFHAGRSRYRQRFRHHQFIPGRQRAAGPGRVDYQDIDVNEGDEVEAGDFLRRHSTEPSLPPTLHNLGCRSPASRIRSPAIRLPRCKTADYTARLYPALQKYADLQKAYYDQQVSQYKAQVDSFDAKIAERVRRHQISSGHGRYQQRRDIAQQIEDMQTTLQARGAGSKLTLLNSQDQRLEADRALDLDHTASSRLSSPLLLSPPTVKHSFNNGRRS